MVDDEKEKARKAFTDRLNAACDSAGIKVRGRGPLICEELKKRKIDVTGQAVHKWLRSHGMPAHENIVALASWLNVRAEWLEYGIGAMKMTYAAATQAASKIQETPTKTDPVKDRINKIRLGLVNEELERWLQFGENMLMSRPPGQAKKVADGGMKKSRLKT